MHELGYTKNILQLVVDAAKANDAHEVRKVCVTVGELRDIVDDLFRGCFEYFARGTVAQGATLQIDRTKFRVRCDDCGLEYTFPVRGDSSTACPRCKMDHYHVVSGLEFYVNKVEIS
jgi:hydrogenase nickel incorporation protein HypA/HybF